MEKAFVLNFIQSLETPTTLLGETTLVFASLYSRLNSDPPLTIYSLTLKEQRLLFQSYQTIFVQAQ